MLAICSGSITVRLGATTNSDIIETVSEGMDMTNCLYDENFSSRRRSEYVWLFENILQVVYYLPTPYCFPVRVEGSCLTLPSAFLPVLADFHPPVEHVLDFGYFLFLLTLQYLFDLLLVALVTLPYYQVQVFIHFALKVGGLEVRQFSALPLLGQRIAGRSYYHVRFFKT